jgi:hypothetical protein
MQLCTHAIKFLPQSAARLLDRCGRCDRLYRTDLSSDLEASVTLPRCSCKAVL